MGMSRGTDGSIPPTPVLGTALTLPTPSFPAEPFRTWGINNPHPQRAVPRPWPNAPNIPFSTVQGHRFATRRAQAEEPQGGEAAEAGHTSLQGRDSSPAPPSRPLSRTRSFSEVKSTVNPALANPRVLPTRGWVPAEGLSTHTCPPSLLHLQPVSQRSHCSPQHKCWASASRESSAPASGKRG